VRDPWIEYIDWCRRFFSMAWNCRGRLPTPPADLLHDPKMGQQRRELFDDGAGNSLRAPCAKESPDPPRAFTTLFWPANAVDDDVVCLALMTPGLKKSPLLFYFLIVCGSKCKAAGTI